MIRALLLSLMVSPSVFADDPPLVLSNEEIAARLDPRTPEAKKFAEQRKHRPGETEAEYKARGRKEQAEVLKALKAKDEARRDERARKAMATKGRRMLDQMHARQAAAESNRQRYNEWAEQHNRMVDAYEVSRAQAWGSLDANWELQRRTMILDSY